MPILGVPTVQPRCDFQENWKKQDKGKYKSAYEKALEAAGIEGSDEGFEQWYDQASGGSPRVNTPEPRPPGHGLSHDLPRPPEYPGWVEPRPDEVPASKPSWKVRREAREERERKALEKRTREAAKRNKNRKNAPVDWEATGGQERVAVMGILGGRKR